jgi:hypothetical protein
MEYSWVPYAGAGAIVLAIVLIVVTAALVVAATRLRAPIPGPTAGAPVVAILVVVWILSILAFLVDIDVYGIQAKEVAFTLPSPPNPVTPVTLACAGLCFVIVAVLTPARIRTRLGNALLCACVGPMIFELPFDLIVMARTSAIPPFPGLYVALFFLPLFSIELLTIALAITRPAMRLTRWSLALLAAMFGVFAVWAAIGFTYPSSGPLPLAFNIVSKVLAFAVALSLFARREYLPLRRRAA